MHQIDGETMHIRKMFVKDQTESREIVLFILVTDEVSNDTCYIYQKNMRIQ